MSLVYAFVRHGVVQLDMLCCQTSSYTYPDVLKACGSKHSKWSRKNIHYSVAWIKQIY